MTNFSDEARQQLEASGWREDRRIDISTYKRALLAAGHRAPDSVCDFLERYGDLEVEDYLDTRLIEILRTVLVSPFSDIVGETLYIVGSCCFDFMALLMDDSGNVYRHMYMTSQNFGGISLYRVADTGGEAIETLIQEASSGGVIYGESIAHRE